MKRFHVHVRVEDLAQSLAFYSQLFGVDPTRHEPGYAKWMLEDPRINFAISTGTGAVGVNHLGMQVDSAEELPALQARAHAASDSASADSQTSCCYARSVKHWVTDPQGVAWEQFHTLGDIPTFHDQTHATADPAGCAPATRGKPVASPVATPVLSTACCA